MSLTRCVITCFLHSFFLPFVKQEGTFGTELSLWNDLFPRVIVFSFVPSFNFRRIDIMITDAESSFRKNMRVGFLQARSMKLAVSPRAFNVIALALHKLQTRASRYSVFQLAAYGSLSRLSRAFLWGPTQYCAKTILKQEGYARHLGGRLLDLRSLFCWW